jgi:hypothetical protein
VAQQCTPRFFTTTDSLAALVSQAVANFDKRHRRDTEPQREWTPPLVVGSVTRLEEVADTVVEIGPAEDGLPMLLQVSRSDNLNRPLSEIARVLGQLEESGVQTSLDAFLRALLKNAEGAWRKRGVCDVLVSPSKSARCYVTSRTVAELLSTSLLGSLLPPPRLGDFAYHSPIRKEPATHLLPTAALDVRIQSLGGRNRFLAIPLVGEQRLVVGKDPAQDLPVHAWHEFIYESLAGFEGCEYYVGKGDEALSQGPFEGYARSIDRIFREWMNDDGKAELDASFSISRAALAGAVVQLLTSLQEDYHKSGSVHGDVKPQNSLVTQKGAILIDGLELKAGDVAPAISPVWAAPEQVSMGEVSAPTDIYPVGLIVVSLLGCQLVGEIVRHQIPSEDAGAMTVSFVKNPAIYLPYDTPVVPPSRRSAWSAFVSKCLRFEPEERFSCAGTCADELRTLIEDSPPSGRVTLPLHRGELRLVRLSDGQDRVSRLICDQGYGSETVGGTGPYSPPPPPTAPNVW